MPAPSFDNSYARLPERFYQVLTPDPAPRPGCIRVNDKLADELGLDREWLHSPEALRVFAGNRLPAGAASMATAYAGHQFGHFNPQLGDGRALLIGEVVAPSGKRFDIQLKGSGRTPYSRGGDGRSPLGPVLREYVVSEAMHVLGVPTSRSLAAVFTGAPVYREQAHPGAVLTRVAASHIRVGTFEFFASRNDVEGLKALLEHALERHYPDAFDADADPSSDWGERALALLRGVVSRQAQLIARWQLLGFIHGVMNTDNSLISGETIDYGPCAFMDEFHPSKVFSSIDSNGRYAYGNQPHIGAWNARALAQALSALFDESQTGKVQAILDGFGERFHDSFGAGLRAKMGIESYREEDDGLVNDFLKIMRDASSDFTLCFRRLADLADPSRSSDEQVGALFSFPDVFKPWLERWRTRLSEEAQEPRARQEAMYQVNPALIPRNHLIERAIVEAETEQHFCRFHDLVDALQSPFAYSPARAPWATPPKSSERVTKTFCGT